MTIHVTLQHGITSLANLAVDSNDSVANVIEDYKDSLALPESYNVISNRGGLINDIDSRKVVDGETLVFEKKAASKAR
jgi:hypothetical protein